MKHHSLLLRLAVATLAVCFHAVSATAQSNTAPLITIETAQSRLTLMVGPGQHLFQLGYGSATNAPARPAKGPSRDDEFYPSFGDGFVFEPALRAVHVDGNTSTDLRYVKHETVAVDTNVSLTRIELKDSFYPFSVVLHLKAYRAEDIIEQWTEIRHEEDGVVTLDRYASSSPRLPGGDYWLTQLHGNWADEANLSEEKLTWGMKVLDTKLGVRAHQNRTPVFLLAKGGPAREDTGEVYGGSLGWAGNYQFTFDLDATGRLRALAGINPLGSTYRLARGRTFTTPKQIWTWSGSGKGQVSRNFHRWTRHYILRDPAKNRPVLLNNWEATHFTFDEKKLVSLFDGARDLGAELFLLDDGWFGETHPRDNDKAGLGDWMVDKRKLPSGLTFLVTEAQKRGIGFGIWLEPEMVNPASALYEKHPDWVIRQAHRETNLLRTQLVLDLTRPEVREFAWKVIDDTLQPNPGISYVKWDCNRYVNQPGSSWLKPEEQSHLLIDYQWALYDVMARFAARYTNVMAMLCSGGGGRVDFESLRYFHTFWPSDKTDPRNRVFIQWGYSHFFPADSIAAHVTRMGKRPFKFTLDVALSGSLGFDIDVARLSPVEKAASTAATALYKSELRATVQRGELYRLVSPYEGQRAALNYVSDDRARGVLFVYQIGTGTADVVKPRGLDPQRRYRVREVNLPAGATSALPQHDKIIEGAALMRDGVPPACTKEFDSAVITLTAE